MFEENHRILNVTAGRCIDLCAACVPPCNFGLRRKPWSLKHGAAGAETRTKSPAPQAVKLDNVLHSGITSYVPSISTAQVRHELHYVNMWSPVPLYI